MVDDDDGNRDALERRLRRQGYRVSAAADGMAALQHVEAGGIDAILLDVMMPGISGLEVLERLRAVHTPARLPIIMATACDGTEEIVAALKRGANDYVTKPLDFAVVLARLQTHLALKHSIEQVYALEARLSEQNAALQQANEGLLEAAARTRRDLQLAARVQETFLPASTPMTGGARFSWAFRPCEELAGDALNIVELDSNHVAIYVLDVSGHGVAASLLAVNATRLLSLTEPPESIVVSAEEGSVAPVDPATVADRLNQRFQFNEMTAQYFTLFYGVLNTRTREFRYVSAGHPYAVRVGRDGECHLLTSGSGLPIGVGEGYSGDSVILDPGDRLYLYSDGVTEAMDAERSLFGSAQLTATLKSSAQDTLANSVSTLMAKVDAWCGGTPGDDVSIVAMQCP